MDQHFGFGKKEVEHLEIILNSTIDLIFSIDKAGNINYVNDAMIKTLEYKYEEIIGVHISKMFSSGNLTEVFNPVISKGASLGCIWKTKGGREIHGEIKVSSIYDTDGGFAGACGIFRDNTKKIEAEKALRLSKEKFEKSEKARIEMSESHYRRISILNEAYLKFVPKEFLMILGKKNIAEVELGDQKKQEMTILISDIRSFTTLSEDMTPQENFNFLNSYFSRMCPYVHANNGVIDKFIGDSIMALFDGAADDALNAAIQMQDEIKKYNGHRASCGYKPISIGIGINTGLLILGTIGYKQRMETTVISDSVNLAFRMEGLTKLYGASIITSIPTLAYIKEPGKYHYRVLDVVKVKGRNVPELMIEILDGLPGEEFDFKLAQKDDFEKGIKLFRAKKFKEAFVIFRDLRKKWQKDRAVDIYLKRCIKFLKYGMKKN